MHGSCRCGRLCPWRYGVGHADAHRQADERLLISRLPRTLEVKDVVSLLRAKVQEAGGVSAWSKKTGIHRTIVSKVLHNSKPLTKSIIKALKLRIVFVVRNDQTKSTKAKGR